MERSICVIPARYASTRLPGKPLLLLNNKPIVIWVYEAAIKSKVFDEIVIATDDQRIRNIAYKYGAKSVLTGKNHPSGSDRVWEVVKDINYDIVVNLQGDEPFIKPGILIDLVNALKNDKEADIATPVRMATGVEEITSQHTAKVITNKNGMALYFSRAPIPYPRNGIYQPDNYLIHIGIYHIAKKHYVNLFYQDNPKWKKRNHLSSCAPCGMDLQLKLSWLNIQVFQ